MRKLLVLLSALVLASCAPTTKQSESAKSVIELEPVKVQVGIASFYGGRWIGRKTANGEIYRATDRTAAHRTLPFDTRVRVTDLKTGGSTIVRINNRGPYIRGRVIDLSVVAAREIGLTRKRGIAKVKLEILPRKKKASTQLAPPQQLNEEDEANDRQTFAKLFGRSSSHGSR